MRHKRVRVHKLFKRLGKPIKLLPINQMMLKERASRRGKFSHLMIVLIIFLTYRLSAELFPFAGERQNYALPQFQTLALIVNMSTKELAEALDTAHLALPHVPFHGKFSGKQGEIISNQLHELNAFVALTGLRSRVGGYMGIISKDLADQVAIGILSEREYNDVSAKIHSMQRLVDSQYVCAGEAQITIRHLEPGLTDDKKATETLVESMKDIMRRVEGKDVISRCLLDNNRVIDDTEKIIAFHDEHVQKFNQKSAENAGYRDDIRSLLTVALFLIGASVKNYLSHIFSTTRWSLKLKDAHKMIALSHTKMDRRSTSQGKSFWY